MENQEKSLDVYDLYQGQLQTYVSFTSFMTAVCVFFVGFLLSTFNNYDISVRVPIAFLVIGIFSFLYSTLLYTNATSEVSVQDYSKFIRAILIGDAISEYWGVYLLVASIPLTINSVTTDLFLRLVTLCAALIGLTIYQLSNVSTIEHHFPKSYKIMALINILFMAVLSVSQMFNYHFILLSLIFLAFMVTLGFSVIRLGAKNKFNNA